VPKPGVIAILAFAVVLAACGEKNASSTKPTPPPDIRREVMSAFVGAVTAGDAEQAWSLLSKPSQRRVGPATTAFAKDALPRLRRTLVPFSQGRLPVEVSENIDNRFGILALSRGAHAWATPMRREGGTWRVELPGRLRLAVLGPPPGSRGKFSKQIGVESHGPGGAGLAVLYLDGVTLDPRVYSGPKSATIFANFANALEPGRHTAVAFVSTGSSAAARAWTFVP
jgi:hypothetical protein